MDTSNVKIMWWVGEMIADTETTVFAVTAGLGSGKTHGAIQWHYDRCALNGDSPFSAFVLPTYQKIHDSGIPKTREVLTDCGLREGVHFRILKSPHPKCILLTTGHEIHFISADHPEVIVAVEYSHATVDEAGSTKEEAARLVRTRVRCKKAKCRQTLYSGVPQGITWFAESYDSDLAENWIRDRDRDHTLLTPTDRGGVIKSRRFRLCTEENPYLPPDYIDQLKELYSHNPAMLKSYLYGHFAPFAEGLAVPRYLSGHHDIADFSPDPYRDLVLTFDFNFQPMTWIAIQKAIHPASADGTWQYIACDEANTGETQLQGSLVEFAAKFPVEKFGQTRIRVFGDRSGHAGSHKITGSDYDTIRRTLRKLGYQNVEICAAKGIALEAESLDALNRLFYNDLLLITPKCRRLKKSLLATTLKKGTRKIDKPQGEDWTHSVDAAKYWAWQETRDETGKHHPKVGGVNI